MAKKRECHGIPKGHVVPVAGGDAEVEVTGVGFCKVASDKLEHRPVSEPQRRLFLHSREECEQVFQANNITTLSCNSTI